MKGIYVGIDVGGTHTDGVAVEGTRILHKVKVPTRQNLEECTLSALGELLEGISTQQIERVVLSTTLVTNAVAAGELEPTGTLISAGPGVDPALFAPDENCRVVKGAVDHRGREILSLDDRAVTAHLDEFHRQGIRALAVVGKFSVRNPSHELQIAELAEDRFSCVSLGHSLSGSLNFPRRVATTYLSAGVCSRHGAFVGAMTAALDKLGISAPLYLLRADGGTHLAASFRNPAETALSGPAASIMGVEALDEVGEETLALDIGGTTTDISVFTGEAPLLEPLGATIGDYRTQIRSLFNRSTSVGGDSLVHVHDGQLMVGPKRRGPPAAFGGGYPTPTDALVFLGRTVGDRSLAAAALDPVAQTLRLSLEQTARGVLKKLAATVGEAIRAFLADVNAKPVYTIHELLEEHRVCPTRAVAVGGPARAVAPYLEEALDLPIHVPSHYDVANAIGAALARVNLEVNLLADTARGYLSIPEGNIYREIPRSYSAEEAQEEARSALLRLAEEKGVMDPNPSVDLAERESFRIVEGFNTVGSIHRIRAQIRPGILGKVA